MASALDGRAGVTGGTLSACGAAFCTFFARLVICLKEARFACVALLRVGSFDEAVSRCIAHSYESCNYQGHREDATLLSPRGELLRTHLIGNPCFPRRLVQIGRAHV